jgi:excisionase family DNA binding protein
MPLKRINSRGVPEKKDGQIAISFRPPGSEGEDRHPEGPARSGVDNDSKGRKAFGAAYLRERRRDQSRARSFNGGDRPGGKIVKGKKLTLSEMAERLSVTTKTLSKYVELYRIPYIGIGRNKRFDPDKVERLLEKVSDLPKLPDIKPAKKKIEINSNPERDFFRRELGLI